MYSVGLTWSQANVRNLIIPLVAENEVFAVHFGQQILGAETLAVGPLIFVNELINLVQLRLRGGPLLESARLLRDRLLRLLFSAPERLHEPPKARLFDGLLHPAKAVLDGLVEHILRRLEPLKGLVGLRALLRR